MALCINPGVRNQVYTDETLNCVDCNAPFTFSAGEQEFFAAKGFTNKPNRCPDCRAARKAQRAASGGGGGYGGGGGGGGYGGGSRPQREMYTVTCSNCGGRPPCRSNRAATSRSTAAIASNRAAAPTGRTLI